MHITLANVVSLGTASTSYSCVGLGEVGSISKMRVIQLGTAIWGCALSIALCGGLQRVQDIVLTGNAKACKGKGSISQPLLEVSTLSCIFRKHESERWKREYPQARFARLGLRASLPRPPRPSQGFVMALSPGSLRSAVIRCADSLFPIESTIYFMHRRCNFTRRFSSWTGFAP